MRSTHTTNAIFHHNSDYSGDITIVSRSSGGNLEVPFLDLKQFFSDYVREQRLRREEKRLGNLTADEVLL